MKKVWKYKTKFLDWQVDSDKPKEPFIGKWIKLECLKIELSVKVTNRNNEWSELRYNKIKNTIMHTAIKDRILSMEPYPFPFQMNMFNLLKKNAFASLFIFFSFPASALLVGIVYTCIFKHNKCNLLIYNN